MVAANPLIPTTTGPTPWLGSQKLVDDSMANMVTKLASADSNLNRMARTEGLKAANSRGLLNSSMAVGASQDAVLKNVLPIASQDSAQAFQKNMAAKAFEYGMTSQVGQQAWQTAENIAQRGFLGTQAELDRNLQRALQTQQINSQQLMQTRQIAATAGIEAANRKLSRDLQENDIQFRMKEGNLDRAAALQAQKNDIAFQTSQNALTRNLQREIANLNISATEKAGAAQFITNMETMYQSAYNSILSNENLDAATRTQYLTAIKNMRNDQLDFVRQMYHVPLTWSA